MDYSTSLSCYFTCLSSFFDFFSCRRSWSESFSSAYTVPFTAFNGFKVCKSCKIYMSCPDSVTFFPKEIALFLSFVILFSVSNIGSKYYLATVAANSGSISISICFYFYLFSNSFLTGYRGVAC